MSIDQLIRSDLQRFNPYSSARDEAISGNIWLNANELPFPSRFNGSNLNRYPDKQPQNLIDAVADLYQVLPEQLLMSRGSDELIDLLIRLCCEANKDAIMITSPTFGMYAVCANLQNANVIDVPLLRENNYAFDINALKAAWNPNVKIIFICSPNNPTGNVMAEQDLLALCEYFNNRSLIVVDEAYIEFAAQSSATAHIKSYENLCILRTFSKAYGMAGLRLGSLLADARLIAWLKRIIAPYPIPGPVAQIAMSRLTPGHFDKMKKQIKRIKQEKNRLMKALNTIPTIKKIWPSEANFLLVEVTNAAALYEACMKEGIVVRQFADKPMLSQSIRITVGKRAENTALLQFLDKFQRG